MKRVIAVAAVSLVMLAPLLWTADAWARAGRGGSSGSRGTRSYSAPAVPSSPARTAGGSVSPGPALPTPPSGSGLGSMVGGLVAGSLLGSLLFGGGGGFGIMDVAILGLLAYLAFRRMRAAQLEPAAESTSHFAPATPVPSRHARGASARWGERADAAAPPRPPEALDESEIARVVTDIFLRVQAAWTAGEMERASEVLTPEIRTQLQKDSDDERSRGRINRIENVEVKAVEMAESWQEPGRDFVTVRVEASLLDYVVDERTGAIVEGSAIEPVTFAEYWTLTRAVWVKAWRLGAIQQPTVASA